jgi:hypothetical protein
VVTRCASPIKAEVLRVTLLDQCGVPIVGEESAQVTSDSFTEISNSPNYEEGQRFLQRKANGEPCVNERDSGFLNWIEQTVSICTLDPDLVAVVTGDDLITDGPDNIGVIFGGELLNARYSMEVWQPVAGSDACDAEGNQRFIYWAFPHMTDAQIQEFTFANDVFTFGWMGITKPASPLWDIGDPYLADNPAATWGPNKHFAFAITTVAPPEPACGAVEVSS